MLRLREVMEKVGLGEKAIYARMLTGNFPRPVKLSHRCVRWPEHIIEAWVAEQMAREAS